MATTRAEADALWRRPYAAGFVVPPVAFEGRGFVRLGGQAYNDSDDCARFAAALTGMVRPG